MRYIRVLKLALLIWRDFLFLKFTLILRDFPFLKFTLMILRDYHVLKMTS
jgi:hypothetical protein